MARPRGSADPPSIQARIVAATAPVFEAEGYAGASTRALAGAADINVSTLAYHFGGKEGLYHAVLDARYAELLAFPVPDDLVGTPADRVMALTMAVFRFARAHRGAVRILLRHALEHGRLPDAVRVRWMERSFERVAALQAAVPGVPMLARRLELLTVNHLIARYAVTAEDGLSGIVEGDPDEAVARHLGEVAVRLLVD